MANVKLYQPFIRDHRELFDRLLSFNLPPPVRYMTEPGKSDSPFLRESVLRIGEFIEQNKAFYNIKQSFLPLTKHSLKRTSSNIVPSQDTPKPFWHQFIKQNSNEDLTSQQGGKPIEFKRQNSNDDLGIQQRGIQHTFGLQQHPQSNNLSHTAPTETHYEPFEMVF